MPTTWEVYLHKENLRFVRYKTCSLACQLGLVLSLIAYDKTFGLPRVRTRALYRYGAHARTGGVRKITSRFEF